MTTKTKSARSILKYRRNVSILIQSQHFGLSQAEMPGYEPVYKRTIQMEKNLRKGLDL